MINNFVQIFSNMLSEGVLKTSSIVLFFMSILAAIDFVLVFVFEYAADFMSFVKIFLLKIFRYSIFFAIARLYVPITDEFVNIIFRLGYLFFPAGKVPSGKVGLPNFDEIYSFLYAGVLRIRGDWAKLSWYQLGGQLSYLVIIIVAIIAIFLIIKEIIVNFVEIKIIIALGVLLLPFNVFEQTKSIGAKLFHALLNSAGKLLVSIALTGVTLQILQTNLFESNGNVEIGNAIAWTFLLGLAAYLITNSKELGSMLINGTASGNANNVFGQAMGLAMGAATAGVGKAVVGASAVRGGYQKARSAAKSGKNMRGILNAAKQGMKQGAGLAKSSRLGKVGGSLSRGLQNTVGYATGNRSAMNIMNDIWGATVGTATDQIMYDSENQTALKEKISYSELGSVNDYIGTFDSVREAFKEARDSFRSSESSNIPYSKYERYKEAFKSFRNQMKNPNLKKKIYEEAEKKFKEKKRIHKTREKYMKDRKESPFKYDENGKKIKKDIWNEDIGKDILNKKYNF